jgi:phosphoenolpyruvate-protein kinase (PTS system EI component)
VKKVGVCSNLKGDSWKIDLLVFMGLFLLSS